MIVQLRRYQHNAAEHIRNQELLATPFRTCIASPTGSGKTVILSSLLQDPQRQSVFTHRRVLLEQLSRVLTATNISHGFRASGYPVRENAIIQLCMIQTEHNRVVKNQRLQPHPATRIHLDEIHCVKGTVAQEIMNLYADRGADVVGYTATPADLGGVVDDVYWAATTKDLIDQGYLCPPRVFACSQPDMRLLAKLRRDAKGEYMPGDMSKLVKPHIIFAHVIEQYKRLNPDGRPFILFAHSVKSSIWWAEKLTFNGIPTAHIDGDHVWVDGKFHKSDKAKRNECFDRLEDGSLKGVSNRFVLREGIDRPCIGHAILTAPVGSRVSFVQMCGRVLRPYENREYAIIQDHAGVSLSHPPLDSTQPWDWRAAPGLQERVYQAQLREDEEPEGIVCPQCRGLRYAGDICPYCGWQYRKYARFVLEVNGRLRLKEGKSYKARKVKYKSGDEKLWERAFWGARKNKPHRTMEQIYTYIAYNNSWRWLPRDLPLMPREQYLWFIPVGEVPLNQLRKGK